MKMTGKQIIARIAARIDDKGEMAYDSTIIRYLRNLNHKQTLELFTLGDVAQWSNDRKAARALYDHINSENS